MEVCLFGMLSEGFRVCVRDLGLVGKGCDVRGRVCVPVGRARLVLCVRALGGGHLLVARRVL